ncbi:hypothetical protein SASPL_142811 [Salvia splendens]|uniref:Uncharacterized protein n=1 Tax=Salvia splendens TaxID=180675 RepID=A0A8X8Z9E8_SALSN|nr:hypothetical protein SASPL_142811 [Salvia splendens]
MEMFVEMESHLAVTDRRVDSLHPPDFPGPEPPNAHSDWQQSTSGLGLLSGFNLPPQGQPIYPPVVAPPPPRAPMIPPCSHEDQRVSSCEVISPPSRQSSTTALLPAAEAPPNTDDTQHPSRLHLAFQGGKGNIQGLEIGGEVSNLT